MIQETAVKTDDNVTVQSGPYHRMILAVWVMVLKGVAVGFLGQGARLRLVLARLLVAVA